MDPGCKQYSPPLCKTHGPLKIVCLISCRSRLLYCSVCSSNRRKENGSRHSILSWDSELCETFLPCCNLQPRKLCLTENQHPYRTNNIQLLLSDQWCLRRRKGSNSLKWIKSSTFLCLSGTALAGNLRRNINDEIAQEWINSPFLSKTCQHNPFYKTLCKGS